MSNYKPTFTFQSKITSPSQIVNAAVSPIADFFNPATSVTEGIVKFFQTPGSLCSLVMMAKQFEAGQMPECPNVNRAIGFKKSDDGEYSYDCICPDENASDNKIPIVEKNLDGTIGLSFPFGGLGAELFFPSVDPAECMRSAASENFQECLLQDTDFDEELNKLRGINSPWTNAFDQFFRPAIDSVLKNTELSFDEKTRQIEQILEQFSQYLSTNGWDDPSDPAYQRYTDGNSYILASLQACSYRVFNDPRYNGDPPTAEAINQLMKGLSKKPEKKCPPGRRLTTSCDCECILGLPCGSEDCIDCSAIPGSTPVVTNSGNCICQCPEGQKMYHTFGTSDNPSGIRYFCAPECPEGYKAKVENSSSPPNYASIECYCLKESWGLPPFFGEPSKRIPIDACESIGQGAVPNPEKDCECDCPKNTIKHFSPDPGTPYYKCLPPCPEGSHRNYDTEECVCDKGICPEGSITPTPPQDPCNCQCPALDSGKFRRFNPVTRECECSYATEIAQSDCAPNTKLNSETCECICPKDYCTNGSLAIDSRVGGCECICIKLCNPGFCQNERCECVPCEGSGS